MFNTLKTAIRLDVHFTQLGIINKVHIYSVTHTLTHGHEPSQRLSTYEGVTGRRVNGLDDLYQFRVPYKNEFTARTN